MGGRLSLFWFKVVICRISNKIALFVKWPSHAAGVKFSPAGFRPLLLPFMQSGGGPRGFWREYRWGIGKYPIVTGMVYRYFGFKDVICEIPNKILLGLRHGGRVILVLYLIGGAELGADWVFQYVAILFFRHELWSF